MLYLCSYVKKKVPSHTLTPEVILSLRDKKTPWTLRRLAEQRRLEEVSGLATFACQERMRDYSITYVSG